MNDWTDRAFVMLSPDAIRRGLPSRILEYFARAHLHPARWAIGEVTPLQADAMLGPALSRIGEAYRYRCLDILFGLGPCLMLELRGSGSISVHERALAVRGASTAAAARPGSIRYDLRAFNRLMSLLHVSDGPAEAAAESAVLVPAGEQAPGRSGAWRDSTDLPDFLHVLDSGGHETRDLAAIRRELRAAVLTRIWAALDDRLRIAAKQLVDDGASPVPDDPELRDSFMYAHPAAAVLLLSFEQPADLIDVERRLAAVGLHLDDWQRAVLATSMYFAPW